MHKSKCDKAIKHIEPQKHFRHSDISSVALIISSKFDIRFSLFHHNKITSNWFKLENSQAMKR